jgi:glycosyltransferase involved in cell wall biosynthesis
VTVKPDLRVLFVLQRADRKPRLLNALIDHLPPSVAVEVAVLDGPGPLDDDMVARAVTVHHLPFSSRRSLASVVIQLRRLVPAFDVVQSNGYVPSVAVELARRATRRPTPSVLARHYNREHHLLGRRRHVWIDRWLAGRASVVLAVSPAVQRTLVEEGVPPERIMVVPNGMDWTNVVADADGVARWRQRFHGQRLVTAVGRLDPLKDYDTVLMAFAAARESRPDLHLVIAGEGGPGTMEKLLARAGQLELDGAVTFTGWITDGFDLVAASDVFVQASLDESFGQSVLEAAVLGTPLAVTTVGGVIDILESSYPAYPSLPPSRPDLLAARMGELLDAPEAGMVIERSALQETFGADRMVAGHLAAWARAASTTSPRSRTDGKATRMVPRQWPTRETRRET